MQPINLASVTLGGEFGRRVDTIIEANILKIDIDKTFLADFRQRGKGGATHGYVGLGKFIDALVRLAAGSGDARLIELKNEVIAGLLATQDPDGYIGIFEDPKDRLKILWDLHESAYLIWALVSDSRLFANDVSLIAAQRMADYVIARLSADRALLEDGELAHRPMPFSLANLGLDRALLALSGLTGRKQYRDFVIEVLKLPEYGPSIEPGAHSLHHHGYQYLSHCLAQLDFYRETGEAQLLRATHRALNFLRQGEGLLITGSCTSRECWHDTQSGLHYSSETCMSAYVARILDAMLQVEGDSLYGDLMERDIYNALFAATAPDGSRSRYFTPFDGERHWDWNGDRFCCANNNKRFLADLRSWIYYRTEQGVAVNLYNASSATLNVAPNTALRIEQLTDYPTSGEVLLKIDPSREVCFEVKLRIPRWCQEATVAVNGSDTQRISGGQFFSINRSWKPGDTIALNMPMAWRFIRGRRSQAGRAAILRGPVIFTLNPERNSETSAKSKFEPRLLVIDPSTIQPAARDDSVRPGGSSCTIQAELPAPNPRENTPLPVVLSEYPDPRGQGIYFLVTDTATSALTDDELIDSEAKTGLQAIAL